MNNEPVKFLPLESQIKPYEPDLYHQNLDLMIELDRRRDFSKAMIWIALLGWIIAAVMIFNAVSRP